MNVTSVGTSYSVAEACVIAEKYNPSLSIYQTETQSTNEHVRIQAATRHGLSKIDKTTANTIFVICGIDQGSVGGKRSRTDDVPPYVYVVIQR